jgi:sugar phosphate isomerase/epimerase
MTLIAKFQRGQHMRTESASYSRRDFLRSMAAGGVAAAAHSLANAATPVSASKVIGFTKPFQDVGFERTAEIVSQIGWSGIECAVRKKGQVEPERVEEDLPKLHAALKARNLDLVIATTDIVNPSTPLAEKVLRTMKQLGCTVYRVGFMYYDLAKPIAPQLENLKAGLRDLAAMNKEIGVCGGIQNHSGAKYVGCAVWDIRELIRDIDPAALGTCFDIGHAAIEGGLSWPLEARLMRSHFAAVYVKDSQWRAGPKGYVSEWVPLGTGIVHREFFDWLKSTGYTGPISQHVEYLEGASPDHIAMMRKDCETLRAWMGSA